MQPMLQSQRNRVVCRKDTKTNHWTNMWTNRIFRLALHGCRRLYIVGLVVLLQGCATSIITILGMDTAVVGGAEVTTAAYSTAEAIDTAKTVGDSISYMENGKTLTDHVISKLTGKDCRLFRKIKGEGDYCEPVEIILPILNTKNKIKVFQIIEGIRPINGNMGPLTRQAYWNYKHGVKTWDVEFYMKFPRNDTQVMQFQKLYGIEQVPNVGPKTINMLIKYLDALIEETVKNTDLNQLVVEPTK